jgi:AcrR family transcriptional regulator
MAAFAAVAYERGFAATRLDEVAARAGVPLAVVTRYWPTEVDWLLETVAASTRQLFARTAEAFMSTEGDAAEALHQALAQMLSDMAQAPEMVSLSMVELPALGPLVAARRIRAMDLFCTFLGPAFAALDEPPPDPEGVSVCLAGGLWELIRRHALERRLHELPEALPAVSYVCLSTFFSIDEALRVSARPVARRRRLVGRRSRPAAGVGDLLQARHEAVAEREDVGEARVDRIARGAL